ncbi:MAG: hypothetical protein KBD15_02860 [Candidatus Magasanikbacteria bacterium]|jgi:hypothetical protein|nr:hypothetical protein [Candidatus Magasanikbacteria bacterium]
MKKFLQIFFTTLGIIFFVLILLGIFVYIADPFNIKPLFINNIDTIIPIPSSIKESDTTPTASDDKHPLLSENQEKTLEKLGIDPAQVPTQLTPEMEACFYTTLGETRVNEIKAGATPTVVDYMKARQCL